jgi:hypothetical protein
MGYELHITRKIDWSEAEGPRIELSEWQAIIDSDSELALDTEIGKDGWVSATFREREGALAWDNGQIHAKNPDNPIITKMVTIAKRLNAEVQGDDGEVYDDDGSTFFPDSVVVTAPPTSLIERIRAWIRQCRMSQILQQRAPPLKVGDRVRNPWGELGTVIAIDKHANQGFGSVRVKLDDGRKHNLAYVASGLRVVAKSPDEI